MYIAVKDIEGYIEINSCNLYKKEYPGIRKTYLQFIWLIVLTIFPLLNQVHADKLSPLTDRWSSTIRSTFEFSHNEVEILSELNRVNRIARFSYYSNDPYALRGSDGEIKWAEQGQLLTVHYPLSTNTHRIAMRFDSGRDYTDGAIHSFRIPSDFSHEQKQSFSQLKFAHHWESLQFKWGVLLRVVSQESKTRLEPAAEIGWGDMTSVRFKVGVYRKEINYPWVWNLRQDKLNGGYISNVNGTKLEMSFGEPFGTHMTVIVKDETNTPPTSEESDNYNFIPEGTVRTIRVYLEDTTIGKLGWRVGGSHSDLQGEAKLQIQDQRAIDSQNFDFISDAWGGRISGRLNSRFTYLSSAHYYRMKGRVRGDIVTTLLPQSFADVFQGDSYFFAEGRLEGFSVTGEMQMHAKYYGLGVELGFLDLQTDLDIYDDSKEMDVPFRTTSLPLKGFQIAYATLSGKLKNESWSLNGSLSQAVIIKTDIAGDGVVGGNSEISGGKMVNLSLSKTF